MIPNCTSFMTRWLIGDTVAVILACLSDVASIVASLVGIVANMPSNRTRSRRRGSRLRNRPIFHKVVNFSNAFYQYNIGTDTWTYTTTVNTQLPSSPSATAPFFGNNVWYTFNMRNIYTNADFGQQTEIGAMNTLYDLRKLCRVKVTITPRTNDYGFNAVSQDTAAVFNDGRQSANGRFLMSPYYGDIGLLTDVSADGDFTRKLQDMRGARSFSLAHGGSIIIRPMVPTAIPNGVFPGQTVSTVVSGYRRAPWVATSTDASDTPLNGLNHVGVLINFPPGAILFRYDLKFTFYIAYKGNV